MERKTPTIGRIPRFITKKALRNSEVINTVLQCVVPSGVSRYAVLYWVVYRTKARQPWRWRLFARNGEIIGASTEAYGRRSRAVENAALMGCPLVFTKMRRGVLTTGDIPVWEPSVKALWFRTLGGPAP